MKIGNSRDIHGNTCRYSFFDNDKTMDAWRKKQKLLNEQDKKEAVKEE